METQPTKTVRQIRKQVLHDLDPDFCSYTPDQGMPDTVWNLNDAQIEYIIEQSQQIARQEERKRILKIYNDIYFEGGGRDAKKQLEFLQALNPIT